MRSQLQTIAALISLTLVGRAQTSGRSVHVTLHEGTNMAAALSPDGRTLAIDLLGTLWTMPAAGGVAKPITGIAMDARQPSWSPDGTRIAFQAYWTSTWQIWTVKADGTDLRPVTSSPYDDREPAWSPDGRRIAFSSDRSGSYDVWTLTLATGEVKQVTADSSNEFYPSWDGNFRIAFVSDRRDKPGVHLIPIDSMNAAERLIAASEGAVAAPMFSPDGSTVAFSVIANGRSRLVLKATGGAERNIADPDEDVFPFRPQWVSPSEVLYTADGKIKRRSVAGGAARVVELTADISFARSEFMPKPRAFDLAGPQPVRGIMHPAVSPDGTRVAFAALGDLWLMPVGGAAQRLTHDAALDTDPAWSPDGRSLAFSSDRDGVMNLWIRDVQSGADRQLTRLKAAAMQASWSPDGSRIAFSDPEGQIQIVDIQSGAVTRAHEHLNEAGRASWSPDGRALVVSSLKVYSTRFREGTNQVLRVSLDGQPDRWFDPMPHKSIGMREDYGRCGRPTARRWPRSSTACSPSGRSRTTARRRAHRAPSPPNFRIADLDRRLAAAPVPERRSLQNGRGRVREDRPGDRSAPDVDPIREHDADHHDSRRPRLGWSYRHAPDRRRHRRRRSPDSKRRAAQRQSPHRGARRRFGPDGDSRVDRDPHAFEQGLR
jgi:Tol biopolymer transport system component